MADFEDSNPFADSTARQATASPKFVVYFFIHFLQ